jgi:hypothetical protein
MHFTRAFWTFKIYKKYKSLHANRNEVIFESMHLKNWLLFPLWMLLEFIKRPIGEAYFMLIAEFSWRAGILCSMLKQ